MPNSDNYLKHSVSDSFPYYCNFNKLNRLYDTISYEFILCKKIFFIRRLSLLWNTLR